MRRILSTIVLSCFLFNTIAIDTMATQPVSPQKDSATLAAPSICSNLTGLEHKDVSRIMIALAQELVSQAAGRNTLTIDEVKALGEKHLREKSIFNFNNFKMQFFFHEAQELVPNSPNSYCVMRCRIWDKGVSRTYHVLFPLNKDSDKGFPVHVYTGDEYKRFEPLIRSGRLLHELPPRKTEDAKAIERYIKENEDSIDIFINESIEAGYFAEIEGRAKTLGWDEKYAERTRPQEYVPAEKLQRIKEELDPFLRYFGSGMDKALDGKNLVLIRVPSGKNFPVINVDGKSVKVMAHTSRNAVYIFLDDDDFYSMAREVPGQGGHTSLMKNVCLNLVHEIGVSYDLPFSVEEVVGNSMEFGIYNPLDRAYDEYLKRGILDPKECLAKYPALQQLRNEPVDLDTNLKTRDYAAGASGASRSEIQRIIRNGIKNLKFEDVMSLVLAEGASIKKQRISIPQITSFNLTIQDHTFSINFLETDGKTELRVKEVAIRGKGSSDSIVKNIGAAPVQIEQLRAEIDKRISPQLGDIGSGVATAAPAKPLIVSNVTVSAQELETLASTEDDAARVSLCKDIFKRQFGKEPDIITKAGGRDNAQGEHVDYNEAQIKTGKVHLYSMGGAIQNNFLATVAKRDDRTVRIVHADAKQQVEFILDDLGLLQRMAIEDRRDDIPADRRVIPAWANHTMGVLIQALKSKRPLTGMDIVITSNVPYGVGLSNSAANCVTLTMALDDIFGWNLKQTEIVAFAREGEHDQFVGSTCGWLDQLLIVFSKKGFFAMIDYATKDIRYFESKLPKTLQRVLVNTNMPRELAETEYNDRNLGELPKAHGTLKELLPGRQINGSTSLTLAEINRLIKLFDPTAPTVDFADRELLRTRGIVSEADLKSIDEMNLPSDEELWMRFINLGYQKPALAKQGKRAVLFRHEKLDAAKSFALCLRRMRHQLTSAIRTPLTGRAAEMGDAVSFGELIDAEGRSLRMNGDFQITGDNGAQDVLLDIGLDVGKKLNISVYGRMEGGGGGGNVGFYVDRADDEKYQQWRELVKETYNAWARSKFAQAAEKKIAATFIEPELSEGATVVERKARSTESKAAQPAQATSPYYIGMSMGGTKLFVGLYRRGEGCVDKRSVTWAEAFDLADPKDIKDPKKVNPDRIVGLAASLINELILVAGLEVSDLNNIGCTSPGPLDEKTGIIGAGEKTYNMPFDNYNFVAKLKKVLGAMYVEIQHDAHSGLEGEHTLGGLAGVKNGYYVIQGTGLGGSMAVNGAYYTAIPELTEPGHHIVGRPMPEKPYIFHYRLILKGGKNHPFEVVEKPDPVKQHQIDEKRAKELLATGEYKDDDFIWVIRGERDYEDIVSGGLGIGPLLQDKARLATQFGGLPEDYNQINKPEDLSRLALSDKAGGWNKSTARAIIRYIAGEVGKGLAALIAASHDKPWQLERIVIGSTVGELLGKWEGKLLTRKIGNKDEDFYYSYIQEAVRTELVEHFRLPAKFADTISKQIVRSPITQDVRETAGFDRVSDAATPQVRNAGEAPTAGVLPDATLSDLAPHQLVNSLIKFAVFDPDLEPRYGFVEKVEGKKIWWLGDSGMDKSFLGIFKWLVSVEAERHGRKIATTADEIIVFQRLVDNVDDPKLKEGIKVNTSSIKRFKDQLSLQIEHFGVREGNIYIMKAYKPQARAILDHVRLERKLHKKAMKVIRKLHGGDIDAWKRWRSGQELYHIEISSKETDSSISGVMSYNAFAQLAHEIAARAYPIFTADRTRSLDRTQRLPNYELPTAALLGNQAQALPDATDSAVREELDAAIKLADEAGRQIPTHPDDRYTLFVPFEFFANDAEFEAQHGEKAPHSYRDRFKVERIGGWSSSDGKFVGNILKNVNKDNINRVIALVPNDIPAEQLKKLEAEGVRFILVAAKDLREAEKSEAKERLAFQLNTYVIMLLARKIGKDVIQDSPVYRTLSFYLKSHFNLDNVAVSDYIEAIVKGDVANLIKGYLMYRPVDKYKPVEYGAVAAALISA